MAMLFCTTLLSWVLMISDEQKCTNFNTNLYGNHWHLWHLKTEMLIAGYDCMIVVVIHAKPVWISGWLQPLASMHSWMISGVQTCDMGGLESIKILMIHGWSWLVIRVYIETVRTIIVSAIMLWQYKVINYMTLCFQKQTVKLPPMKFGHCDLGRPGCFKTCKSGGTYIWCHAKLQSPLKMYFNILHV